MSGRRPHPSDPPRPAPNAPYNSLADASTYRDLLLFEERLKMNAEMLGKRRRRYSAFLWSFVGLLAYLGYRLVVLAPKTILALRALQATFAVVLITLVLFFASGMYDEKIRYAHSYINHSNKALRPLNMHLNMRRPNTLKSYIPLPSFRPHTKPHPQNSTTPPIHIHPPPQPTTRSTANTNKPNIIPSIPPTTNPRGELIFSSRVDRSFREGYERYRSAFERRREERARELAGSGRGRWWRGKSGGGGNVLPTPPISRRGTPPLGEKGLNVGEREKGRERTPSPLGRQGIEGNKEEVGGGGAERRRRAEKTESFSFILKQGT